MKDKSSIKINPIPGKRDSSGAGYIYLPSDVDREEYINNVYNTHKVSVQTENAEVLHDVPIGMNALQWIKFPLISTELGSPIYWVASPIHKQPVIVEVFEFDDEMSDMKKDSFLLKRSSDNGTVSIRGDSKNNKINITIASNLDTGGELLVNVTNKTKTGKITFNVQGDIEVFSRNTTLNNLNTLKAQIEDLDIDELQTIIKYVKSVGFSYLDEFENEINATEPSIQIKGKTAVLIGVGEEALALGDTLAQLIKDFLTEISKATTPAGPLLNAAAIVAFVGQVDTILSQYAKTD